MKYVCDGCNRLVDLLAFEIVEEGLEVVCPACGGKSRGGVALAAPPPKPASAAPPPRATAHWPRAMVCPKCAAPRPPGRPDCARCGLVFERFNPEDFALPEPLESLWKDLGSRWSDPASHERFLDACSAAERLTEAVRRYRLKAEQDPNDAIAQRYRDDLIERLMAAAALPSRSEDRGERRRRWNIAVAGLVMLGIAALAFFLLTQPFTGTSP